MKNHQLINQTSGDVEYYTPPFIIEAARRAMGKIDLDPASCEQANKHIKADRIFTREDDGLKQKWWGNVWVNHPFGRTENPLWVNKMVSEFDCIEIGVIMCITFASTSEEWFQPLMRFPQCYLSPRLNYLSPSGGIKKGVSKGSVVTYMGPQIGLEKFAYEFRNLGTIKVCYQQKNNPPSTSQSR